MVAHTHTHSVLCTIDLEERRRAYESMGVGCPFFSVGVTFSGSIVDTVDRLESARDCAKRCLMKSGCAAWSFARGAGGTTACTLMPAVEGAAYAPGQVSGRTACQGTLATLGATNMSGELPNQTAMAVNLRPSSLTCLDLSSLLVCFDCHMSQLWFVFVFFTTVACPKKKR